MKIAIPEFIEVLQSVHIDELKEICDVDMSGDYPRSDDEIIKRIGDAEIVAMKMIKINKYIMDNCPRLKYVITLSIGFNFIDFKYAATKGIKVINCPMHNVHAVAEHVFSLMLSVSRHVVEADMLIRRGEWKDTPYMFTGSEISGKLLLLIGHGNIGKDVEKMAKAWGMKVVFSDSKTSSDDLDSMIKTADFISLNLPYTEKNHHLIDERRLKLMKQSAYFINTARGEIVDQEALYQILENKKIAGAGVDVFENEPINTKPNDEMVKLALLPNVVATTHLAFNTKESSWRLGKEFIENIHAILRGKPINVKN